MDMHGTKTKNETESMNIGKPCTYSVHYKYRGGHNQAKFFHAPPICGGSGRNRPA
jgi:hypothetical protein